MSFMVSKLYHHYSVAELSPERGICTGVVSMQSKPEAPHGITESKLRREKEMFWRSEY